MIMHFGWNRIRNWTGTSAARCRACILTGTGSGTGLEPAARYIPCILAGTESGTGLEPAARYMVCILVGTVSGTGADRISNSSWLDPVWSRNISRCSIPVTNWNWFWNMQEPGTSRIYCLDVELVCCSYTWCINKYIDIISSSLYISNHIMDTWDPSYDYRILIDLHGWLIIICQAHTGSYLSLEDPDYSPLEFH